MLAVHVPAMGCMRHCNRIVPCAVFLIFVASSTSHAVEPAFRFQNNFWVSLHHTLRGEARRRDVRGPAQRVIETKPGACGTGRSMPSARIACDADSSLPE